MRPRQAVDWVRAILQDESGAIAGVDYILAVTILTVGSVTGLVTVRDAVVQDFGDLAIGLENIDQSYTISATFATGDVKMFGYEDVPPDASLADRPGEGPHGIEICNDVSLGQEN